MIDGKIGQMVTELTIAARQYETIIKEKHLIYGDYPLSYENTDLSKKVYAICAKFPSDFGCESPEVVVKTKTVWCC